MQVLLVLIGVGVGVGLCVIFLLVTKNNEEAEVKKLYKEYKEAAVAEKKKILESIVKFFKKI